MDSDCESDRAIVFQTWSYVSVSKPSATWDFAVLLSMSKFLNCGGKHLFFERLSCSNSQWPETCFVFIGFFLKYLGKPPINSMELRFPTDQERKGGQLCGKKGPGTNPVFNCTHPQVSLQRLHSKAWRKAARRMGNAGDRWPRACDYPIRVWNFHGPAWINQFNQFNRSINQFNSTQFNSIQFMR